MNGPKFSYGSSVLSGPDTEPSPTPEELINSFTREILSALPYSKQRRRKQNFPGDTYRHAAEVVSLYLARSWSLKSPWWADQALQMLFTEQLPITKATENTLFRASDLRLGGGGQSKTAFLHKFWVDHTFFQVAAMREVGISAKQASEHAARWRDELSNGGTRFKASVVEKNYPKWARDPLGGKVWLRQLREILGGLTDDAKTDLVQSNILRAHMLPPIPKGLIGERR